MKVATFTVRFGGPSAPVIGTPSFDGTYTAASLRVAIQQYFTDLRLEDVQVQFEGIEDESASSEKQENTDA